MDRLPKREFESKEPAVTDWLNWHAERLEIEHELEEQIPQRAMDLLNMIPEHAPENGMYVDPDSGYLCFERRLDEQWNFAIVQGDDGAKPYKISIELSRYEASGGDVDIVDDIAHIDARNDDERTEMPPKPRVTDRNGLHLPTEDLVYVYSLLDELVSELETELN